MEEMFTFHTLKIFELFFSENIWIKKKKRCRVSFNPSIKGEHKHAE